MTLPFSILAQDTETSARTATLTTAHGTIHTPAFMSVGTFGTVRSLSHEDLEAIGTQVMLGNTYHLYLRPGAEILKLFGGLHGLVRWDRPILTDSGGFQVFSLAHQRQIHENGVTFRSYLDKSAAAFSPESNIAFQEILDSDIMMCLDVCVPSTSSRDVAVEAMQRTHRWAKRCLDARKSTNGLFGIVQGALFPDLRKESAETLRALPFDGYAIGGLAVGESEEERDEFTRLTASLLPQDRPRYLMGVGTPTDIVKAVAAGVDMFDCIIPTNHARQGLAYTWDGKVKLRKMSYAADSKPIDSQCDCRVCQRYSRAYLHQILKSEEPTAWHLIAFHNTWFYERLMEKCRESIKEKTMAQLVRSIVSIY